MITDKAGGSSAKPEVSKQSKEKRPKHKVSGYKSQSKRRSTAGCRLLLRTLQCLLLCFIIKQQTAPNSPPPPTPKQIRSLKATMRRMETATKTSPKKVKLRCLICHMLALFFLELNSKGLYPCSSAEKEKGIDVLCSGPPRNV